jgi:H+/Cl- antiporter ClcA
MNDDLWFYCLVGIILIIIGIRTSITYKKYRTKNSLVTLVVIIVGLVATILAYFYPANTWLHTSNLGRILILVAFSTILILALFYSEIRQIFKNNKKK